MVVSIKLNSTNFPPLRFPSTSKNLSSPSDSLPFITARKSFPCNINIRSAKSIAIATNTATSGVPRISQGNSFPKLMDYLSFRYLSLRRKNSVLRGVTGSNLVKF